ncbi:protein of unknown function [Bosea lupini]|uniref:DarT domain-containing protein n=1 Tax=Bosea lupini TaxID=1036779 RepID=A0A1H7RBM0_9HYPH|nr:DarT ssDNA thymidine ADP-ribosyltransferase family protein [Bosea lupini]SEL57710.1 protein of unknown function [Bosea lupini]
MSISLERANRHVTEQCARLSFSKERKDWPRYLYHATHVDNAIRIVSDGFLSCRNRVANFHDVANQGALANYEGSHDYARLYFRPKNGFHLKTEGIKHLADNNRADSHMSIPVMFLFDFSRVISRCDAVFSSGNVQRSQEFMNGDAAFDQLEFNYIYHDSATDIYNRDHIHNCRMAEVAVIGRIDLDALVGLAFRTKWDMETFRYKLAQGQIPCPHRLIVEQLRSSLFLHWGMYLNDISSSATELKLGFNLPRNASPDGSYLIDIIQNCRNGVIRRYNNRYMLRDTIVNFINFNDDSDAVWEIKIEDVLAFQGNLSNQKSSVFG